LLGLAHLVWTLGDRARGQALFEDGLAVARTLDDRRPLLLLLGFYGYHRRGAHGQEHDETHETEDYARGTVLLRESLSLARATGEPALVAQALLLLAYSADVEQDGERRRARAEAAESLALATQVGHLFGIATAHRVLGRLDLRDANLMAADAAFAAELRTMRTLGDLAGCAMGLSNLGDVARARGDLDGAVALYEQSLEVYRGLDFDRDLMARVLRHLGDLALARADAPRAGERYAECLRAAQEARSFGQTAAALEALATLAAGRAQPVRALRLLGAAAELRRRTGLSVAAGEQAALDRVLERAGQALDSTRRAEAWAHGQALAPEQAVAYALARPGDGTE
jgi:hypothetical protein